MIPGVVYIASLGIICGALLGPQHRIDGRVGTVAFLCLFGSGLVLAVRAL